MRTKKGVVVSAKMDKTVVVMVDSYEMHPIYGKLYRKSRKFLAHDEENECKEGNEVVIVESRPLSKRKCWVVLGEKK